MKFSRILLSNLTNPQSSFVNRVVHLPVLAKEVTDISSPQDGQCFLDMTFGGGGHTKHLLMTNKKITVFALDRDPEAFERAVLLSKQVACQNNGQKVVPLLGRFSELKSLLDNLEIPHNFFDCAIMDLGASNYQYETVQRGFSINLNGPLDMRMDRTRFPNMPTAADVVNSLDADNLARIFKIYGEEKYAMRIAQAIVDSRFMMKQLNTTQELAMLVAGSSASSLDKLGRRSHPATKIFQALRVFVNNELNELNYGIELVGKYLKTAPASPDDNDLVTSNRNGGGLLAIISFNSLEDKIAKGHFMDQSLISPSHSQDYNLMVSSINKKPSNTKKWLLYKEKIFYPSEDEVFLNPRSRSAKLRFGLRINLSI